MAKNKLFNNSIKNTVYVFVVIVMSMLALEYLWCIDKEIIIISITVISATFGYFITHFLEIERKKNEEKRVLYAKLVSGLKIFMGSGQKSPEESRKDVITFEDTYYTSWLYISTSVYEKLVAYIKQYEEWRKNPTEENKNKLNEDFLTSLMQAIRDEITADKKTKFINYILQIKK
jgi:hypothetical protein